MSRRTQMFLQSSHYRGGQTFVELLTHCRKIVGSSNSPEGLHACAELSYLASESSQSDPPLALEMALDTVETSWRYLSRSVPGGATLDCTVEPHCQTAEIYNAGVKKLLRLLKKSPDHHLTSNIKMPLSGRLISVHIPFPSPWLSMDQLGAFEFTSDYELKNLRNRHTTEGLGVPIMARRRRPQQQSELEKYYADDLTVPITVVVRGDSNSAFQSDSFQLELFDPRESDGMLIGETVVPIATDISTPLAWFLTDPRNSLLETFAFLRPDRASRLEGLYMVQPFDPDRIPVLMVHGIWSSPITWMEMFNDLQSDPVLRDKYQFWFYMYPTGEPLAFTTAKLRERLETLRSECDCVGRNRKLNDMVVVGHSMGGLMAYLLSVDSQDKLWNAISDKSLAEIQTDPKTQEKIRQVFFFESDRSIDRIVTIASPFKGSGLANGITRWITGAIVSIPKATAQLSDVIFQQNGQDPMSKLLTPRTSVDSLNKNSAVLQLISQTAIPEQIMHHNIVGLQPQRWWKFWNKSSDGVVNFKSARRTDAVSEVQVEATHSHVHRTPAAIKEVHRILMEHLKTANSSNPLRQISHPQHDAAHRSKAMAPHVTTP
ncbi:MAG: alpha/beta hydrolase [Fuerstiella sp.]